MCIAMVDGNQYNILRKYVELDTILISTVTRNQRCLAHLFGPLRQPGFVVTFLQLRPKERTEIMNIQEFLPLHSILSVLLGLV